MSYLGLDVGSTSVKGVIINEDKQIINHGYLRNNGVVQSVQELLKLLDTDKYLIHGIGVTGSGRSFANAILNADLVKNEILAHSIASTHYYPNVRTIFEIGGEDAKLTQLDNGIPTNFAMNTSCSGGTGTMVENIAIKLGTTIEKVGGLALQSKNKTSIAGKCAVFANSTAVNKRNAGVPVEDILMGVCRAVVDNYFTILVRSNKVNPPYIIQGAVAWNEAIVKCFEDMVQDKVIVPEHPHLMGAIGMALLCAEDGINNPRQVNVDTNYSTVMRLGDKCSNVCEIIDFVNDGKVVASTGNRCDKCVK